MESARPSRLGVVLGGAKRNIVVELCESSCDGGVHDGRIPILRGISPGIRGWGSNEGLTWEISEHPREMPRPSGFTEDQEASQDEWDEASHLFSSEWC